MNSRFENVSSGPLYRRNLCEKPKSLNTRKQLSILHSMVYSSSVGYKSISLVDGKTVFLFHLSRVIAICVELSIVAKEKILFKTFEKLLSTRVNPLIVLLKSFDAHLGLVVANWVIFIERILLTMPKGEYFYIWNKNLKKLNSKERMKWKNKLICEKKIDLETKTICTLSNSI